jgi:sphingomyelin phosphodiesterase 2
MSRRGTLKNLKVLTLNCWAIRYISKDIDIRLGHLIQALNEPQHDYDIIGLQEIWSQKDYFNIKNSIQDKYPYSHYFQRYNLISFIYSISKIENIKF